MPKAKKFKYWIVSEVLPSIRKTGVYVTPKAEEKLRRENDNYKNLVLEIENKYLKREINYLKTIIDLKDKLYQQTNVNPSDNRQFDESFNVNFEDQEFGRQMRNNNNNESVNNRFHLTYEELAQAGKPELTVREIASDYGWTAQKLNKYLADKGVQQYLGNAKWQLNESYKDRDYTVVKHYFYKNSYGGKNVVDSFRWTVQGRIFIYHLLQQDDVHPLIEQNECVF